MESSWLRAATFAAGLWLQAAGAAGVAVAGFWVLAAGDVLGAAFTSAFDPRFGVDGLSGFFLGDARRWSPLPALVFAMRYLEPTRRGRAIGAAHGGVPARARRRPLRARPAHVPGLLGADDAGAGGGDPRRARRDAAARRTVFVYVAITHLGGAGTWIAMLLLAQQGAIGDRAAIEPGSGLQVAIALAALVGFGTKAGLMPLHVWLPRAHPIAPAPVSALMSGVMIKVAIYGLVRVLVEWLGVLPVWLGVLVLGLGALSAVGGVVYALFQHDLKRLLALHSIENIGIIVLGLGACLVLRARGADEWAAFALGAALLHTAQPRGLQGAAVPRRGRVRAGGRLARARPARRPAAADAVDRRRVPGRRDGDRRAAAAERLRLGVADAAGAAARPVVRRRRRTASPGALALAALAATAALARLLLRQGRRARAARPAAPRRRARRWRRPSRCARPSSSSRRPASCSVSCRGCSSARSSGSRLGGRRRRRTVGLDAARDGIAADGRDRASCSSRSRPRSSLLRGAAQSRRPRRPGRAASASSRALDWTSAGFTKPLRLCSRRCCARSARSWCAREGGVVQEVTYSGRVPHLIDDHLYRPVDARSRSRRRASRAAAAERAARHVRRLPDRRSWSSLLAAARIGVIG